MINVAYKNPSQSNDHSDSMKEHESEYVMGVFPLTHTIKPALFGGHWLVGGDL